MNFRWLDVLYGRSFELCGKESWPWCAATDYLTIMFIFHTESGVNETVACGLACHCHITGKHQRWQQVVCRFAQNESRKACAHARTHTHTSNASCVFFLPHSDQRSACYLHTSRYNAHDQSHKRPTLHTEQHFATSFLHVLTPQARQISVSGRVQCPHFSNLNQLKDCNKKWVRTIGGSLKAGIFSVIR